MLLLLGSDIMIDRPAYMDLLVQYRGRREIKVVTGIRRCGKSTLLKMFVEKLLLSGVSKDNIIYINFESLVFQDITDYKVLYNYVKEKVPGKGKVYLVFDEIQMVPQWERAVNSFQVDFDVDIYLTGSNAYLLSSELSTLISGRYVEIKMLPLSFKEFLVFNSVSIDSGVGVLEDSFQKYLKYGGMPAIYEFDFNEQLVRDILEGIYSTVILKDVLERNKVGDQLALQKVVAFLADNVGSTVSPNRIGNYLSHQESVGGDKKSPAGRTVDSYLSMLEKSYIFYGAQRYDIKGKELLKTLGKYYIVDLGIRNMLLGYRDVDRGHILENVVYLELLRRGYRVYIGKVGKKEVDFVAERPEEKIYVQVAESLAGEATRKRELAPLYDIRDNYEKLVLSMDKSFVSSVDGIKIMNIIDYLI